MKRFLIALLVCAALTSPVYAQREFGPALPLGPSVITVQDSAQLAAAVARATAGQTVLVSPGTYALTANLTLADGVSLVSAGGPYVTKFTRDYAGVADSAAVVCTSNNVVQGFWISTNNTGVSANAGCVYVKGTGVRIEDCRLDTSVTTTGEALILFQGNPAELTSGRLSVVNCWSESPAPIWIKSTNSVKAWNAFVIDFLGCTARGSVATLWNIVDYHTQQSAPTINFRNCLFDISVTGDDAYGTAVNQEGGGIIASFEAPITNFRDSFVSITATGSGSKVFFNSFKPSANNPTDTANSRSNTVTAENSRILLSAPSGTVALVSGQTSVAVRFASMTRGPVAFRNCTFGGTYGLLEAGFPGALYPSVTVSGATREIIGWSADMTAGTWTNGTKTLTQSNRLKEWTRRAGDVLTIVSGTGTTPGTRSVLTGSTVSTFVATDAGLATDGAANVVATVASIELDVRQGTVYRGNMAVTGTALTEDKTFYATNVSSVPVGHRLTVLLTDASPVHTATFGSGFLATGTLATVADKTVSVTFVSDGINMVEESRQATGL